MESSPETMAKKTYMCVQHSTQKIGFFDEFCVKAENFK